MIFAWAPRDHEVVGATACTKIQSTQHHDLYTHSKGYMGHFFGYFGGPGSSEAL